MASNMSQAEYVELDERGLLRVSGPDGRALLQGLITNDMDKVSPTRALHAALLTPQGKFLHDFFVAEINGALILDCEGGARLDDLRERLLRYRLNADLEIGHAADLKVFALLGEEPDGEAGQAWEFAGGITFTDPRLAAMGGRAILPAATAEDELLKAGFGKAERENYEARRLGLGLADGSRDLEVEKAVLLEGGFHELNGIDWEKGCYIGQELTARTKHRGLLKRRILPVTYDGPAPAPGTPIMQDGKNAGEMRSGSEGAGLALLRLNAIEKLNGADSSLSAGKTKLTPRKPAWASF